MEKTFDKFSGAFQTPILLFENTALIDDLKAYVLAQTEEGIDSKVSEHIKFNLTESKLDLFERKVAVIEETVNFISASLKLAINALQEEKCGYKILFKESWYHIGKKNSTHEIHGHPNCSWCGVFYVQSGDLHSGGQTVFQSPIKSNYVDHGTQYLDKRSTLRVDAKDGRLLLFPSYLSHYQSLYTGEQPRIVVAFNSIIAGKVP
jgi:uncharacterized protein (TIGR02466 family)